MKMNLFANIPAAIRLHVCLIITLMISNSGLLIINNSNNNLSDSSREWINDQAVNLLTETGVKVQLKLVTVSFADNFFSYKYYNDILSKHPKVFTIISETFSEINIRNSSFLISESSTGT